MSLQQMKRIISLTGPKGVGKSTIAGKLTQSAFLQKPVTILSFADPIKGMAKLLLRPEAMLPENKDTTDYGICGRSPRYIMQTIGTEWGRKCVHMDIWVEVMRLRIKNSTAKTIIIDDLRFENEADMILNLGARIFLVERVGVEYTHEHISESPLDSSFLDGTIVNRTEEDLDAMVRVWNPFE